MYKVIFEDFSIRLH